MVWSIAAGRKVTRLGLCLLGTVGLAGCGGTKGFESSTSGAGTTLGNIIAFNTPNPAPAPAAQIEERLQCPVVEVLDGTASARVFTGTDQSNSNLRYQYALGDVVRECSHVGDQLVLKVGVEGRVLLGPAGAPGSFAAPVRITIRREKDLKPIATAFYRVPVTVPAGDTQADFSLVADPISVPFTQTHTDEDYTIVAGFDEKGAPATAAKVAKVRHKR